MRRGLTQFIHPWGMFLLGYDVIMIPFRISFSPEEATKGWHAMTRRRRWQRWLRRQVELRDRDPAPWTSLYFFYRNSIPVFSSGWVGNILFSHLLFHRMRPKSKWLTVIEDAMRRRHRRLRILVSAGCDLFCKLRRLNVRGCVGTVVDLYGCWRFLTTLCIYSTVFVL